MENIMKKSILAAIVAGGLLFLGSTNTDAQVVTSFRWFNSTAGSLTDNMGNNFAAGEATIVTFLSTDAVVDFDTAIQLQNTYGNDSFYTALPNLSTGRFWTDFMANEVGDPNIVGQHVYALVIQMPFASFTTLAAVAPGTYYNVVSTTSGPLADLNTDPAGTPQSFNPGSLQTTLQVVPEPGTIALLVLGVTMLGARRFLRKKA